MSNQCVHGRLARVCEICEAYNDHAYACEQNERLRTILANMVDLAEYWINRADRREMSEQNWRVWHAAGHGSNAMRDAKAAISPPPTNGKG